MSQTSFLLHMKPLVPVLGICAVLLGGGIVVAPQFVPETAVKAVLIEQVAQATGWQMRLDGRTKIGVFPAPVIQVENVGISGGAAADGIEFAQVGRADLEVSWMSLLTGEPEVTAITLNDTKLFLEVTRGGEKSWRPLAPFQSASGGAEPTLLGEAYAALKKLGVETVAVEGGRVDYRNLQTERRLELSQLSLAADFDGGDGALDLDASAFHEEHSFSLSARVGSIPRFVSGQATAFNAYLGIGQADKLEAAGQLTWKNVPIGTLGLSARGSSLSTMAQVFGLNVAQVLDDYEIETQLQFSSDGIRTRGMKAHVQGLQVTGTSAVTYLEDGLELKGTLEGEGVPFETIVHLAGIEKPGSGVSNLNLSYYAVGHDVSEWQDHFELTGSAWVRNGRIAELVVPAPFGDDEAREAVDDIDLDVTFAGLQAPVAIEGSARWRGEPIAIEGEVAVGGFTALSFTSDRFSAGISGALQEIRKNEGRLSFETGDLTEFARWYGRKVPDYLQGDRLRVAGVFASSPDELAFKSLDVFLDDVRVQGQGRLVLADRLRVEGDYELSELQLDHVLTRRQSVILKPEERHYDFSVLRNLDVDIALEAERVSAGDLRGQNARLRARSEGGRLNVALETLSLYGGTVSGDVLLNGATVDPQFSMDLAFSDVSAAPFFTAVSDLPRVDGSLNAVMTVASEGRDRGTMWRNMDGAVSFQLGSGVLYDLNLNQMITDLAEAPVTGWPLTQGTRTAFQTWGADVMFGEGRAQFEGLTFLSDRALIEGRGEVNLADGRVNWHLKPSRVENGGELSEVDPVDAEQPIAVAGTLIRPSFASEVAGGDTTASLNPVNESLKNTVAAKLQARMALQKKAGEGTPAPEEVPLPVSEEAGEASATTAAIDGQVRHRGEAAVPPQKPGGSVPDDQSVSPAAPTETAATVAPSTQSRGPRPAGSAPETINVDGVASGEANVDDTLSTIEEGFGLPAGFLTGN